MMSKILLCLACLTVLVAESTAQAPPPLPPIAQKLQDCAKGGVGACQPYVDSTTTRPPSVCCDPLESLIKNNVSCVCLIFGNEDVIRALELDVDKAITLPQRCGLPPFDLSANCPAPPKASATLSANAPTSVSQEPSQSPSSMSAANSPTPGGESSGTSNTARIGSAIFGSFFLCATVMFY